ncbi:MAG: HAD hydrolase-like protein [Candidatus Sulfotelmatobacter sp.]
MNVLITSASRKVSLVRAFQSALVRHGGGDVIAVDTSPFSPALYVADRHFLIAPSAGPGFLEEFLQLCKREDVGLVVPTRDEELPLFAAMREHLEQSGIRVMVPVLETVRLCQDKLAFINFCQAHQFGTPRTYQADEWHGAEFPLFVKPRFGKGAKGARVVGNEAELHHATGKTDEWVIQEYIDVPEYTVDLLADFNGRVLSVVPRLRQSVVAGESYVSRTIKEPHLIAESARLATELRLTGHNTIQCFWDGKHVKFVEVNPRFGGGAALGIAAGADTPAILIRLLRGEALPERLGEFEADLVMLRFTQDLFLNARALSSPVSSSVPTAEPPTHSLGNTQLQAILFDLDNTLYPEEEFVMSGFRAVANCLAARENLDAEKLHKRMLHILHTQGRERVFNTLLAELKLDSNIWLRTLLLVYRSHQPAINLFPGVADALGTLKKRGVRLGLITDGTASVQRRKIAALDLERHMDVIVCTDELGAGCAKPSTVPFEVALNLLGVAPNRAAYVADDVQKDFAGPNRLRIKSVQVRSAGLIGVSRKPAPDDPAFLPQIQVGSVTEALKILDLL